MVYRCQSLHAQPARCALQEVNSVRGQAHDFRRIPNGLCRASMRARRACLPSVQARYTIEHQQAGCNGPAQDACHSSCHGNCGIGRAQLPAVIEQCHRVPHPCIHTGPFSRGHRYFQNYLRGMRYSMALFYDSRELLPWQVWHRLDPASRCHRTKPSSTTSLHSQST